MKKNPGKIARFLLRMVLPEEEYAFLMGDYEEELNILNGSGSRLKVQFKFWKLILESLPGFFGRSFIRSSAMFKNYFKIMVRNVTRNKGFTFISTLSLATGITVSTFAYIFILDDLSYDSFHEKGDKLYMICTEYFINGRWNPGTGTPPAAGPAFKEEYPDIVNTARMKNGTSRIVMSTPLKKEFDVVKFGDASIFEMFTFPLKSGSLENTNNDPYWILISEKIAEKYFDKTEAVGKTIIVDNTYEFTVAGVFEDMPLNSMIRFDIMVPLEFHERYARNEGGTRTWTNLSFRTYAELNENASLDEVNAKIVNRIVEGNGNSEQVRPFLRKYNEIFLYGITGDGYAIGRVILFGIIGIFILSLACINFMNLSIARSTTRAKEVGMRKVIGAHRANLIKQFLGESIFLSGISAVIAVGAAIILVPHFNMLTGKSFTPSTLNNTNVIIGIIIITFVTGLISGSYPAFILSAFRPVRILKGVFLGRNSSFQVRKALVIFQFIISIALIICTLGVKKQYEEMIRHDLGYNAEHIVYMPLMGPSKEQYFSYKNEILKIPEIKTVTAAQAGINAVYWNGHNWRWEGRNPEVDPLITYLHVDEDLAKTFEMKMISGSFFNNETINESNGRSGNVIINEVFAEIMEDANPVGKQITNEEDSYVIKGVIKNFNFKNLNNRIGPLIIFYAPAYYNYVYVKLQSDDLTGTIAKIEDTHNTFNRGFPFVVNFLDEEFETIYRGEELFGITLSTVALLAVLISCLGLFGLASCMTDQRTKEIGIRKTLGASRVNIIYLLSVEFTKWVMIANMIAWPVAWMFLRGWLTNYAIQMSMGLWIFLGSGFIAVIVTIVTVSFQSFKAASADPVNSLRYE